MDYREFFWLHIKKSGGITTRRLLQPYYVEVDRTKKPKSFIQASPEEFNDILNNFRIMLGEFQFRRTLFAKTYLYPDTWNGMLSFAFSREPVDRCVSMFYYLYWPNQGLVPALKRAIKQFFRNKKLLISRSYAFDVFLDYVQEARISDSIFEPLGNHFSTHTAPMWEDITDLEGNLLLKKVFRLENLIEGINRVFEECGLDKRLEDNELALNRNMDRGLYSPTKQQVKKIEGIYGKDFEIYEQAGF
jgi:hypothetical protein